MGAGRLHAIVETIARGRPFALAVQSDAPAGVPGLTCGAASASAVSGHWARGGTNRRAFRCGGRNRRRALSKRRAPPWIGGARAQVESGSRVGY